MKKPGLRFAAVFLLIAVLISNWGVAEEKKGPERWEGDIAKFEKRDKETKPEAGALLFVGSSSIRMWDLSTSWPDLRTINNGFGGSTLADSIHHYKRLIARYPNPSALILYAGDNDIAKGLTPEEVSRDFQTLVSLFRADFPETPVVYIAIKPSRSRWNMWPKMKAANDLIAAQCKEGTNLYFADIAVPMLKGEAAAPADKWFLKDGLHLTSFGYEEWTKVVRQSLQSAGVLRE